MIHTVPNLPGIPVQDDRALKEKIAKLLDMRKYRFPGAQPVSFGSAHMQELQREDYFVAEKSDGVRCLALLLVDEEKQPKVYLFDRKSNFHLVDIRFPIPQDPSFRKCLTDTIIDGELVLDTEPDGRQQLRFLLFDCLVIMGKVLTSRDFTKRLGYLNNDVIRPHENMLKKNPHMRKYLPFSVSFKEQQFTHHLDTVFNQIIPALKHGNDGLIFTSVNAPYSLGTCEKMIKWKPAEENSVDFKVALKFPGSSIPGVPDFTATPRIDLLVWQGETRYEFFDQLGITDSEWKSTFGTMPAKKLEGRIIECNYDVETQERYNLPSPWRFMRFRDDKPDGNHQNTVDKVLCSIRDAVSKEELIDLVPRIREASNQRKKRKEDE